MSGAPFVASDRSKIRRDALFAPFLAPPWFLCDPFSSVARLGVPKLLLHLPFDSRPSLQGEALRPAAPRLALEDVARDVLEEPHAADRLRHVELQAHIGLTARTGRTE